MARSSKSRSTSMTSKPEPKATSRSSKSKAANETSTPSATPTLKLIETIGDIFSAPPNTLLIHACNTEGTWGAGIAKAFHDRYPAAYQIYKDHCALNGGELVGSALLIPPQPDDSPTLTTIPPSSPSSSSSSSSSSFHLTPTSGHFIGCLFTSLSKGRKVDAPAKILAATGPAMKDLLRQIHKRNNNALVPEQPPELSDPRARTGGRRVGEIRMCKINSGLFRVKWERTREVLENIEVLQDGGGGGGGEGGGGQGGLNEICVVSRDEEE